MTIEAKQQILESKGIVCNSQVEVGSLIVSMNTIARMSDDEFTDMLNEMEKERLGTAQPVQQSEKVVIKRLMQLAIREFNETVIGEEKHLSRSGTHVPVDLIHSAQQSQWQGIIKNIDHQFGRPTLFDSIYGWLIVTFKRK